MSSKFRAALALVALIGVLIVLVWTNLDGGPTDRPAAKPRAQASAEADASDDAGDGSGSGSDSGSGEEDTAGGGAAYPRGVDTRPQDGIDACRDNDLPEELAEVADDVESGGPFEYPGKDGSTFGNYEGLLPDEGRGYYSEFTVPTPGERDRGARRIITGGGSETDPEVWYYTDDHYESFCEFAPAG